MPRIPRRVSLFIGFALAASACSGGGESATPPITAPVGASPNAGQDLLDLITSAPDAKDTTSTTLDRLAAEQFVIDLVTTYFEAVAAHDWDAVYEASSESFSQACPPERYAAIVKAVTAEPTEIEFVGEIEVSVVGDFATGQLDIFDQVGTRPVSGLLAVAETGGWRVSIDPCDAASGAALGDASYPLVIAIAGDPVGGATEATIPTELTTTTTVPGTPTTTTIPGTPLTAADRAAIETVLHNFISAYASQNWVGYHAAVPPLFECTPADTATTLAPFHFSPSAVAFGPMAITGASDEATATFDVRYLDSLENVTVVDLGAWEWGGVWYAAVHPCTSVDLIASDGAANGSATELLLDTLSLARALYVGAGDYDIPTSALNTISASATFVEDAAEADTGTVAYVDAGQDLLIVTRSGSGMFYCVAENSTGGAHYARSFYLDTIDTLAECRSIELAVPWSTL